MSVNNFKFIIPFFLVIFLIPSIYIPSFFEQSSIDSNVLEYSSLFSIGNSILYWPVPGYTTISSYFGNRTSPTTGASSFHKGIDIAAPAGSNIIAVCSSLVTFTGFDGSGGYTIILKNDNYTFIYCHVSPNYIIKTGDYVLNAQIIGQVGPKNVYTHPNNPYKDSNGNPTNGATTRSTLTFFNKKRRPSRQSIKLLYTIITYPHLHKNNYNLRNGNHHNRIHHHNVHDNHNSHLNNHHRSNLIQLRYCIFYK